MADNNSVPRVDPSLVAEIVCSYAAKNHIAVDQIGNVIATVHQTLSGLMNTPAPAPAAERLTPAVPIRRSVQPEYVVCLECGFRAQTLRLHLRMKHGFDAGTYRARWKLPSDHPMTAPAYSAQRSVMAKQHGLGRQPGGAGGGSLVGRSTPDHHELGPFARDRGVDPESREPAASGHMGHGR